MEESTWPISPWFAQTCAALARACASLGVVAPAFRAPPAVPGADRTLRRLRGGRAGIGAGAVVVVAVRLRGRAPEAIRADLIEGVVAANDLPADSSEAARLRAALEEVVPLATGGSQAA